MMLYGESYYYHNVIVLIYRGMGDLVNLVTVNSLNSAAILMIDETVVIDTLKFYCCLLVILISNKKRYKFHYIYDINLSYYGILTGPQ